MKNQVCKSRKHPRVAIPASANANFCAFCGKQFDPDKKLCFTCFAELDPRGKFCNRCGQPQKTTQDILEDAFRESGCVPIKVGYVPRVRKTRKKQGQE